MRNSEFIFCLTSAALQCIVSLEAARASDTAATAPPATQTVDSLDPTERACQVLKKQVDDSPGRMDVAVDALERILSKTSDYARIERGAYWQEYAAKRLIALEECGQLPRGRPPHMEALKSLYTLRRDAGRNWEAHQLLGAIEELAGADRWCRIQQAELLARMGRREEAQRLFRDIAPERNEVLLQERIQHVLGLVPDVLPTFSKKMDLLDKCAALAQAPAAQADMAGAIFRQDAQGGATIQWDQSRVISVWAWMDRRLAALGRDQLALLRSSQDKQASAVARSSGPLDFQESMRLFRQFPLAAAAHRALMASAEDQLRQGRSELALSAFRDILGHSDDPTARGRAQVGVWLALAQDGQQAEALAESLAAASEGAYPWLGGQATVRAIRERLGPPSGQPASQPAALGLHNLERRDIDLPPQPMWTLVGLGDIPAQTMASIPFAGWIVEGERRFIVAGPRLIVCYDREHKDPRWTASPRISEGLMGSFFAEPEVPKYTPVPGEFVPAVAEGKVFARWGQNPVGRYCKALAAFDLHTGEMAWSTEGMANWKDMWPLNDPTVSQGRLYVLMAEKGLLAALPVALVCADAATGKVIWKRHLATQDPSAPGRYSYAHFGNPVTVHQGAVYCASNLGFVAKCDARDGLLEWAFTYQRDGLTQQNSQYITRRMGAAPIVAGDLVIFAPRDRQGAFALDRGTGELRWENVFVPSERALGKAGGLVLFKDAHTVVAVEPASGKVVWDRYFDEQILPQSVISGSAALVGTRSAVCHLDGRTGAVLDQGAWGAGRTVMGFSSAADKLLMISSRSVTPEHQAKSASSAAATAPGGPWPPMVESWRLVRSCPRLLVPPREAKISDRVFLLTENILECIAAGPRVDVRWQRLIELGFRASWVPNRLLLVYGRRVLSLDPVDGSVQRDVEVPFSVKQFKARAPWLVLGEYEPVYRSTGRHTCVIDVDSGKLLWHSRFIQELGGDSVHNSFSHIEWEGQNLHLFGARIENTPARQVICRPADGEVLLAGKDAVGVIHPKKNYYEDRLKSVTELAYEGTETPGPWFVAHFASSDRQVHQTSITRIDDPSYELVIPNRGTVTVDSIYEIAGNALNVIHLATKQKITYTMPISPQDLGRGLQILQHWEQGKNLLVLSGIVRHRVFNSGDVFPSALRLDVFDRDSRQHIGRQLLPGSLYSMTYATRDWGYFDPVAQTQAALLNNTLFIADPHGLHAYVAAPEGRGPSYNPHRASIRRAGPAEADGVPDNWTDEDSAAWDGTRPDGARLCLSRDAENLHIALSVPSDGLTPFRGRSEFSGGNMIEFNLQAGTRYNFSYLAGLDEAGRLVLANQGDTSVNKFYVLSLFDDLPELNHPKGTHCIVRYDALGRRMICELCIPLKYVVVRSDRSDARSLGVALSVAVWDNSMSCMVRPMSVWRGLIDVPEGDPGPGLPRRSGRLPPRP